MAQRTAIALTGDDLTVADVWAVAVERAPTALSDQARVKMRAAREVVERAAHGSSEHTYGVNTGFGRFVNRSIPEELTRELQLRLLRSHACGVGEPYPDEVVRSAMLLRANTLAKGNSGARVVTVELLLKVGDGIGPVMKDAGRERRVCFALAEDADKVIRTTRAAGGDHRNVRGARDSVGECAVEAPANTDYKYGALRGANRPNPERYPRPNTLTNHSFEAAYLRVGNNPRQPHNLLRDPVLSPHS